MAEPGGDFRGAGLAVPPAELRQVEPGTLFDRQDEVLAGCRLAVVALEIEVAPGAEPLRAGHRAHHADHLGALVVDGRGVEVRDFLIGIGPDRVSQRPGILGELGGAQHPHVLDPLDRIGAHRRAEQLVTQHGEAFLEAELEPVAARYPVA